jgi:hypothetical protein
MANDKEAQGKKLGEVIKKAWDDDAFMQRLLDDATPVLKEHGVQVPEGMQIKVVTNSGNLSHLVIPPKPTTKLSDEDLDKVSAGGGGVPEAQLGCQAAAAAAYESGMQSIEQWQQKTMEAGWGDE